MESIIKSLGLTKKESQFWASIAALLAFALLAQSKNNKNGGSK